MTVQQRRNVLVTGASRGLGLETALVLAENGFRVWAGVRDMETSASLHEAAGRRGVKIDPLCLDVTRPETLDRAFEAISADPGGLFGVVNNAGVTARAYFEEFPEERVREIFEVNLFGTMNVTRRALPLLRKGGGGRIVNITSIGGRIGSMSVAPYCASKFAIEGFSEALALEVKPFGIDVVIVEPGMVNTEIWAAERRLLPTTRNTQSPYYRLFWNSEAEAEKMLKSSTLTTADVAACVLRAITVKRPKLRYVVGWRPRLVLSLRRHLPGELFERLYFGELLRRAKRGLPSPDKPSGVALADPKP